MEIVKTYIGYDNAYKRFVKLYYCTDTTGVNIKYFIEETSKTIYEINSVEFYNYLNNIK